MYCQSFKYLYLFSCVLIVNILAFGGALNFAWSSPVLPKLAEDNNPIGHIVTDEESSWIASLLALGASLGAFIWGYLSDTVGRKYTLLLLNVPFTIAYITLALSEEIGLYYAARFIAGVGLGGVYIIIPMYFVEICDVKVRGILSSTLNLSVTLGMLFTYGMGSHFDIMSFTLICLAFPLIFYVLGFIFLVETPFYLLKIGKHKCAEKSLMLCRGVRDLDLVREELKRIEFSVNEKSNVAFGEILNCENIRKGLFIALTLLILQQASGINVILSNTESIFRETKSDIPADMSSLYMGIISFAFAFISTALVDKLGRKFLLLLSAIGMFVSELALGYYFYLLENDNDVSNIYWLPILSLLTFIASYNIGFAPVPWVILAEVLPDNVKNKLSPFGPAVCCLLAFLFSKLYPNMKHLFNTYGTFWFFTSFNVVAILFTIFVVPETKGKTFDEIQTMLRKK